jgi:hypothetical protein
MAYNQLLLYNDALLICGERFLANLSEEREPRRLLDQVWASEGVKSCLEKAQWFFAMRTIQIDYDPSIEPPFGYARAFQKPTDWVLTSAVCSDEFFRVPLTRYNDEAGYWYSDLDTMYIRYVSQDTGYGMDMAKWPDAFREFVAAHFASKIALKLSGGQTSLDKAMNIRKAALKTAKSNSAMADSTKFAPPGSWSQARMRGGRRRDGGNNNSGPLIG